MNQLILIGAMVIAAALGATGQMMLQRLSGVPVFQMPFSGYAWAFAFCYGLAVMINVAAYKLGGKASVLYPVIALSYVFTIILAWKFLGETISGWSIAGTAFIVIGVGLIGWGAA
jgi:uncharacterized membrane protein